MLLPFGMVFSVARQPISHVLLKEHRHLFPDPDSFIERLLVLVAKSLVYLHSDLPDRSRWCPRLPLYDLFVHDSPPLDMMQGTVDSDHPSA